ncbi:MAG: hypothetical protein HXM94_01265 [Parvimonas micra]|uniref:Uncharacterized protein n=1 Tax=Parvimonas micra TaxID=33033 RepID=A0A930E3E6_9FIRM|nr:hypothetical protein [Parvimonas micra]MBF1306406.1 hypothetical protein [Parvimonas micra]
MIKEEQKSERSESLEKLRLLANDDLWIETQIEKLTNSWSMDYISSIGTVYSRNSFKNSETFEEFIEKAKHYYKDVFDDKKTDQLMIKLFGSSSKEKKEFKDFDCVSYYDIVSFSREPIRFISLHGEKYSIDVFKACLKITEEEFDALFPNFNIVELFESINQEEWNDLVSRKYYSGSLYLEINVFYDFEDKRILFKNNKKNSASIVNLGKMKIEVSKTSSKKTPMLTAILSGDLLKIKKRFVLEIKKMFEKTYLKFLSNPASINSVIESKSISAFVSDENIDNSFNTINGIYQLKKFYSLCSETDKERVLKSFQRFLER